MDASLVPLITLLFAASVVVGSRGRPGTFNDVVGFTAEIGSYTKGRFNRKYENGIRMCVTFDTHERLCPLVRSDGSWRCQESPETKSCTTEGLALVSQKKPGFGKLKVYRTRFTRPSKNVVMYFCAGPGVTMTKNPTRPTYFWSKNLEDPAVMKIASGLEVSQADVANEYFHAYARGHKKLIEGQWSPAAKKATNEGLRLVKIPTESGRQVRLGDNRDPKTSEWEILVRIERPGSVSTFDYFMVNKTEDGGEDQRTFFTEPHLVGPTTDVFSEKRLSISCPAQVGAEAIIENHTYFSTSYLTALVAGEGVEKARTDSGIKHEFSYPGTSGKRFVKFPSPGSAICGLPFPEAVDE